MGYIGSDPVRNDSVSTAQLVDDAVTSPKIVDDIVFTNVTASNDISASGTVTADKVYVSNSTGMYTDKIRRYSDSDNTTKILLNDEILKLHAGHSTNEVLNLSGGTNGIISGSATSTGSFGSVHTAGNVGIGTAAPDYTLDVAGNVGFNEYIYHNGDADTFIRLQPDEINIEAGGENMIFIVEGGGGDQADKVTINNALADVDFQVKGDNDANLIRTIATTDKVGIGNSAPTEKLTVTGDISASGDFHGLSGTLTLGGHISGSSTSTGSFGRTSTATLDLDSIQGNWTNAGNTVADLGSITTVDINGGTINGITDLAVADGGTGASSFTDGYVLLGSGTGAITALDVTADGAMLVGDGTTDPVAESGATLRTSIGVGTTDSPTFVNVTATGTVTAQEFHTEFVSASIVYTSGSTKFGDTSDDLHSFTGSIAVSGSISGSSSSTGSFGDGRFANKVGIGTTSPGVELEIVGSVSASVSGSFGVLKTGDLELENKRGHWRIVEESEYLSITNVNTNKKYKFVLEEIE